MEFSDKEINLIKDILAHYTATKNYIHAEENKSNQLIANKGKDPILQDLFLDSLKKDMFHANLLSENLEKMTKGNPRTKNKTFREIMRTFDGSLTSEDVLLFTETWGDACDVYCKHLSNKQALLNKTINNSQMIGIDKQKREVFLSLSERLLDVTSIYEEVRSFIITDKLVEKPKAQKK